MAVKDITYQGNKYSIYYDLINPKMQKNIIILHGWGSNKDIMKSCFSPFFKEFRHVYIDMPGFGKSKTKNVLTTKDYQQIISSFLKESKLEKDIIIGHSFGGKVASLLQPDLLVLLSSAGIVPPKSWDVRFKIKLFKFLKLFGLGAFRRYFASKDVSDMDQNMYETFKNVVDEDFTSVFSTYDKKALIFWGKSDTATPLSSGKMINTLIKDSKLFALDGDHFFFTKHAKFIADTITEEFHG